MFKQVADDFFTVALAPGSTHCGPNDDSPRKFRYHVEMRYPDSALDERGFLLDNLAFGEYFSQLGTISFSCERLAIRVCHDLARLAAGRCARVDARIYALPSVYVEHSHVPGEETSGDALGDLPSDASFGVFRDGAVTIAS